MGLFNRKVGLFSDVIRCDEPDYLIWKWHPNGFDEGGHKREYEIRWGSSLRVKDGEVAVFVYKQKDGTMQDYIEGPFDEKIKTTNFPILSSILAAFNGGSSPFQAEIYFINLAKIVQVKFAAPYFDVFDYRYPDLSVPVAARGTLTFSVDDYKAFIKLHRMQTFTLEKFQTEIRDFVSRYLKGVISKASSQFNIPVVALESRIMEINEEFESKIKQRLKEDFGVLVMGADIGAIDIDRSGSDYEALSRITKAATISVAEAEIEAKKRRIDNLN